MLAEADLDLTNMAFDASHQNRFSADDTLLVKFYLSPKKDEAASTEAGRPIFKDVEFISIKSPGDRDSEVIRPARETDIKRFPRHYAAFKNNEGDVLEGTPLEEWPGITRSQVEEMKHFNVRTIEQLVGMSDANAQGHMGINQLRTRAKAYLAAAEDNAANEKLAADLAERDNKIEVLEQNLETLQARLAALEEAEENE